MSDYLKSHEVFDISLETMYDICDYVSSVAVSDEHHLNEEEMDVKGVRDRLVKTYSGNELVFAIFQYGKLMGELHCKMALPEAAYMISGPGILTQLRAVYKAHGCKNAEEFLPVLKEHKAKGRKQSRAQEGEDILKEHFKN